jgi:hypothetical protein
MGVVHKVGIVVYSVSDECGRGMGIGKKWGKRRERRRKEERTEENKKNWGRERKVEHEKAKQTDIWTEWKRELGNNRLFLKSRRGEGEESKNKDK